MSASFERRLSVSVAIDRVWSAMTDPAELNQWYFPIQVDADGAARTVIDGRERASEVVEFEVGRMFRTRTTHTGDEQWPPLPPSTREMTVVLESTDSGTTIVITHSGFGAGDDWEQAIEATKRGVDETMSDLLLYLQTGVGVPRHPQFGDSYHGIGARQLPAGLQVMSVQPGSFADRLGLAAGDMLVEIGGAAVFGFAELFFFCREHRAGEVVAAAWVRGGALMRGTAELGPRHRTVAASPA